MEMTIEAAFRLRLQEILGDDAAVFGIETSDVDSEDVGVAFQFEHGTIADQWVTESPALSMAGIVIIVSADDPADVWRVSRKIRLGLAEEQRAWPLAAGLRRRIDWVRPAEGSQQKVIDDPKRYGEMMMFGCCFDDTDEGLVDTSP